MEVLMHYSALATDYDGTLAQNGQVGSQTIQALERLRRSGRRLILVTGRELPELLGVFARPQLFDRVVAENGGLLYDPATQAMRALAEPPAPIFVQELKRRDVDPLSVGRSMVATIERHERSVKETISALGLRLQVILNKGSVMVLPTGVDKATGLAAALDELGISPRETIGVGDAENDEALLAFCGLSVAVANALPAIRRSAHIVTNGADGRGVTELIDRLLAGDLPSRATGPTASPL
jgi:hydroxymethylpyrimidine pyrophosphatase-like HAD family hydrolase